MFPVVLDLAGRLAAVVGGGTVGRRKAAALLAAAARVRLVCLEPRHAEETDARLDWLTEPYRPDHLNGASLVFAAGPVELNGQVVADARARGLWVNSASKSENSDFILPAVVRRGGLLLAVSTGGASPALARAIRDHLDSEFDEAFAAWVALLAEMRPLILVGFVGDDQRRAALERLCQWSWLERLRREGVESVRQAMKAEIGLSC